MAYNDKILFGKLPYFEFFYNFENSEYSPIQPEHGLGFDLTSPPIGSEMATYNGFVYNTTNEGLVLQEHKQGSNSIFLYTLRIENYYQDHRYLAPNILQQELTAYPNIFWGFNKSEFTYIGALYRLDSIGFTNIGTSDLKIKNMSFAIYKLG